MDLNTNNNVLAIYKVGTYITADYNKAIIKQNKEVAKGNYFPILKEQL
jgi:hypothetical protein